MTAPEQNLITASELTADDLQQTLGYLFDHQLDYADLYFQSSVHESWVLEDGLVKDGSFNIERGVGVRAISGEKTGFAYADTISAAALKQAANAARGIAAQGQQGRVKAFSKSGNSNIYLPCEPLQSLSNTDKVAMLHQIEAYIRTLDSRAEQVMVSLSGVYEEVLVAASDGTFASDIRPLVRLNCSVLLQQGDRRERGSAGGGGRTDYSYFSELVSNEPRWQHYAREAVRQAQVNLTAIDAPAGTMP
ncbi:MAG TPA: DNA gyrase modulator, partial [Rheinheimera sp.]|nr:DNA gyrase modulator [Rheinheimera sp.]